MRRSVTRICAWSIGLFVLLLVPATASAIDEFTAPGNPTGITAGPDGALWFTEETDNKIGRMTTGGVVTNEIPIPTPTSLPAEITVGPDSKLWFTEFGADKIGRVDDLTTTVDFTIPGLSDQPDGIVTAAGALWFTEFGSNQIGRIDISGTVTDEYSTGAGPGDIVVGPDGGLWFTESTGNSIRRFDPVTRVMSPPIPVPGAGSDPSGITSSGGALWFTESGSSEIGRVTTSGTITEFGPTGLDPSSIATGPDGALWFTESMGNQVGRITPTGVITNQFALAAGSEPSDIAAGPDSALWFTEKLANKVGRIAIAPPFVPPLVTPPVTVAKSTCKVPKLKGSTAKQARKKLKRAHCKFRLRGKGRVTRSKPRAGVRTTKRVEVTLKKKRRTAKRAVMRRLITVKGGLQQ